MTLADFRVAIVFMSVVFLTVLISALFGIRGIYFVLSLHTLVTAFCTTFFFIATGKL